MKKKIGILLLLDLVCLIMCICMFGHFTKRQKQKYYADRDNYITTTGVLIHIKPDDETGTLYLGFSEMDYAYDDINFKIIKESYQIASKRGLDEKLKIGETVSFVSAPRYFGDGYVMPIVEFSIDGVEYLSFEEGYDNLQHWLA